MDSQCAEDAAVTTVCSQNLSEHRARHQRYATHLQRTGFAHSYHHNQFHPLRRRRAVIVRTKYVRSSKTFAQRNISHRWVYCHRNDR